MGDSQEIGDYADDDCYIPEESMERKNSEKKTVEGQEPQWHRLQPCLSTSVLRALWVLAR